MTPLGPLLSMAQAATREQAQAHARALLAAGASPADVADALTEWDRLHDQQVRAIPARFSERYDPSPEPIDRRIS